MRTERAAAEVQITPEHVALQAPYNADMPARARALGGTWHAATKTWRFHRAREAAVRALAVELYGTDGASTQPLVGLRIPIAALGLDGEWRVPEITVLGRVVARVLGRDDGVRLHPTAAVVAGTLDSGGSRKNPGLTWSADLVLEVLDMPERAARDFAAAHAGTEVTSTAMPASATSDERDALLAERAELLERLALIDATLGGGS